MIKKIKIFLMSIACFFIPGCDNNSIDHYIDKKEKVDLRTFFNGNVEGWGSLFDYQGKQTRSFFVKIKGTFNGNVGTLEEWFDFDDGEKSQRTWDISFSSDQEFVGKAHDVIGDAKGIQKGNAINLHYTLRISYDGSTLDLSMDDWMYKLDEHTILNRTSMKKFGFKVGELVLFMKKMP